MLIAKQPKSINELIKGIKDLPNPLKKIMVTHLRKEEIRKPVNSFLPRSSPNEEIILIAITFPKKR